MELTDENSYRRKTGRQAGQLRSDCRSCSKARARRWYEEHPDAHREHDLKRLYGIGLEDYEARYIAADGRCAICRRQFEVLCVDHDHATGQVRGLLCHECNLGIGNLGDNLVRLSSACTYIERGLYATSGPSLRPRQHAA